MTFSRMANDFGRIAKYFGWIADNFGWTAASPRSFSMSVQAYCQGISSFLKGYTGLYPIHKFYGRIFWILEFIFLNVLSDKYLKFMEVFAT